MQRVIATTLFVIVLTGLSAAAEAKGKQAQAAREPDLCAVPPGAPPLLRAKLTPRMAPAAAGEAAARHGHHERFSCDDFVGAGAGVLPAGHLADPLVLVHGIGAVVPAGAAVRPEYGDGALVHRAERRRRLPTGVPAAARSVERRWPRRRGIGRSGGDRCRQW